MFIILGILAIIGLWLAVVALLSDDTDSKSLEGMSNPILFDHIKDKHFK